MKKPNSLTIIFAIVAAVISLAIVGCGQETVTLKPAPASPGSAKKRFEAMKKMRDGGGPPTTAPGSSAPSSGGTAPSSAPTSGN